MWQPIDSAPMDGTPFLLYLPDGRTGIGFIDRRDHEGITFYAKGAAAIGADPYNGMRVGVAMTAEYLKDATHWQPLPTPPGSVDGDYVLVPRVPTEEMIHRFVSRALCVSVHGAGGWSKYAREQWDAMLSAAPVFGMKGVEK